MIEFLYDFGSPNAYLVHKLLPQISEKHATTVAYQPILLGGVFKATNNQSPITAFAGVAGKLAYQRTEMVRFIERHRLQFRMNPHFPVNTITLMRGAIHAQGKPWETAYIDAIFAARYPGWEICLFGHIGDGNLHVNWMKPDDMSKDEFLARVHDADRDMFELVKTHRGSVSAEHGIGLLKREWLGYSRSPDEIAMMRAIKAALDPDGIMNPGKLIPLASEG